MSANKLKDQVFELMRDEYGAMCCRINSGIGKGYVAFNYWYAPVGSGEVIDKLIESGHVANENADAYMPSKRQTEGFSDTVYMLPGGVFVAVELKDGNDQLSEAQIVFLALIRSLGHIGLVIGSTDELVEQLDEYGVEPIDAVVW